MLHKALVVCLKGIFKTHSFSFLKSFLTPFTPADILQPYIQTVSCLLAAEEMHPGEMCTS